MATATYGLDVIYGLHNGSLTKSKQVPIQITKDVAGLNATTAACDAIRSADIPPIWAILDRQIKRHCIRKQSQNNSNVHLVTDKADGIVDEEHIPSLDSWTERAIDHLWVPGDKVK
jgi:uncharacterized protein (UPF0218 family)